MPPRRPSLEGGLLTFDPDEGEREYAQLEHYAETRRNELSRMLGPFIEVTDSYGELLCRLTGALGFSAPRDKDDSAMRDLMADVFDFLYEARRAILGRPLATAFPLARRAYESLALLAVASQDRNFIRRWSAGEKLHPGEVRSALSTPPMSEDEESHKELYNFFCTATHPNRGLVSARYLGEPNQFVLGAIGVPDSILVADYCHRLLALWFWFGAIASYIYREEIKTLDPTYIEKYRAASEQSRSVTRWLTAEYARLLEERRADRSNPEKP